MPAPLLPCLWQSQVATLPWGSQKLANFFLAKSTDVSMNPQPCEDLGCQAASWELLSAAPGLQDHIFLAPGDILWDPAPRHPLLCPNSHPFLVVLTIVSEQLGGRDHPRIFTSRLCVQEMLGQGL